MSEISVSSYDEVPYSDGVFCCTRPEAVGAIALLHGMNPAAVDRCRVLELGCGTGGNLIPMAQDLPGSHFVGVDLSPRQVEQGRQVVQTLGLQNIELRALDLVNVDESFGAFDFIICHGVYSWVPAPVQDRILSICKQRLAECGVAYVSYNTYPGWHIRGMIRAMMSFHVARFRDPAERIAQARGFLGFLTQTVGGRNTLYGGLLQIEADLLDKASDTYIYHEHLEEVNAPVYFHQFAQRAEAKGLQFLAEAQPSPLIRSLSLEAQQTIERMSGSLIEAEQYLDFVRNRSFRRTLLCHDHVRLSRPPLVGRLPSLYLSGLVQPVAEKAGENAAEEFRATDGATLTTNDVELRAALRCLGAAWPAALGFDELLERVRTLLPKGRPLDRAGLAEKLLQCYFARAVDLHLQAPKLVADAGERPRASPLARLQATLDRPVSNLRHRHVRLDPFDRLVLQQLDGTRNRGDLIDALTELVVNGTFTIELQGQELRDPQRVREVMREALDGSLQRIAGSALLGL